MAKSVLTILIILSFVSCMPVAKEEIPVLEDGQSVGSENNGGDNNQDFGGVNPPLPPVNPPGDDEEDHDDGTGGQSGTGLPVQFMASQSSLTMELAQKKIIMLTVRAGDQFENSNVNIDIDMSALQGGSIDAGNYIQASLSESQVFLGANGSANILFTVDVKSMAPSFSSKSNGGEGTIILKARGFQGGEALEKELSIDLAVIPQLSIGIISDSVPHEYDQPNQIYTRAHAAGVQVVFENKTMNFGVNGNDGPCIHTTSPLRHCDLSSPSFRMKPGDKYIVPVKVLPSRGYRRAVFYNHYNSSDNINRFIHFNVTPGEEGA